MATRLKGPLKGANISGLGNRAWFKDMVLSKDPDLVCWMNDFIQASDLDTTNDWTDTQVDGGTDNGEVFALAADSLNGELTITTNDADDDSSAVQLNNEFMKLASGKRAWFEARVKVDDADTCDLLVGLSVNDTTPLDASDRVNFKATDGSAALSFEAVKNSTATTEADVGTLADDTYITLGIHWDGKNKLEAYVDRSKVATVTANIPDDENLAPNLFIQNGSAAASTLTVDYIFCAKER